MCVFAPLIELNQKGKGLCFAFILLSAEKKLNGAFTHSDFDSLAVDGLA